ncbi:unnamed protein product [Lactuca saligna]|uniref:Uncharacterized protein n=1 Tax=Lactuca saligna TaxID=75948 RepID=A0AA36A0E0_LACSI|nr:unnamed protein product [Lactuca saligna]
METLICFRIQSMGYPLHVSLGLLSLASTGYLALAAIGTLCNPTIGFMALPAFVVSIGCLDVVAIDVRSALSIGCLVAATIVVRYVVSIGSLARDAIGFRSLAWVPLLSLLSNYLNPQYVL